MTGEGQPNVPTPEELLLQESQELKQELSQLRSEIQELHAAVASLSGEAPAVAVPASEDTPAESHTVIAEEPAVVEEPQQEAQEPVVPRQPKRIATIQENPKAIEKDKSKKRRWGIIGAVAVAGLVALGIATSNTSNKSGTTDRAGMGGGNTPELVTGLNKESKNANTGVTGSSELQNDIDSAKLSKERIIAAAGEDKELTAAELKDAVKEHKADVAEADSPLGQVRAAADKSTTINRAVIRIKTNGAKEYRSFVKDVRKNPDLYDLKNSNAQNKMVGLKDQDKNMTTANVKEGAALGVANDAQYAAGFYNDLKGRNIEDALPKGVTVEEAQNYVLKVLGSKDTKFTNVRLNGTYANGMINEKSHKRGVVLTNFQNVRAVKVSYNGKVAYIKIGGGNDGSGFSCLNLAQMRVIPKAPSVPGTPYTPGTPPTTPGTPNTPNTPGTPPTKTPRTPDTPNGGGTPNKTPAPEKRDPNTTPGGVPGHDGGSGGNGPEATRPVPGPAPSNVEQPQAPTPAPIASEPAPTAPAETGVDPGVNGPAAPANGSGSAVGTPTDTTRPGGE